MKICKDLNQNNPINSIADWFSKCPPQSRENHWVDSFSAKKTVKQRLRELPKLEKFHFFSLQQTLPF